MAVSRYIATALLSTCALAQGQSVVIDILPAEPDNFIDTTSNNKSLQVGVLSTSPAQGDAFAFDATTINPATVRLGAGMAVADDNYLPTAIQDVDNDGDDDLNLVFQIPATGIACEDTNVALSGLTYGGQLVNGYDTITTPDCPSCHEEPGNYRNSGAESFFIDEDAELNIAGPIADAPATAEQGPVNGSLTLAPDGAFIYAPDENFFGLDAFSYRNSSGVVTNVSISVAAVNDAPTAAADSISIASGTSLRREAPGLLGNDQDIDGDTLQAILDSGPQHGSLGLNANGSYRYTPGPDFTGSDSFSYVVNDGVTNSEPATVTIGLPNIVLMLVDDMGQGDASIYNPGSAIAMPNLTALAAAGIRFDNAHAPTASCSPSRYSILTGNYPYRGRKPNGVWKTLDPNTMIVPGQMTLADALQAANYNTGFIGKLHNGGAFWNISGTDYTTAFEDVDFSRAFDRGPTQFGFNYSFLMPGGVGKGPYAFFENDRLVRYDDTAEEYQPFTTAADAQAAMIQVTNNESLNGGIVGLAGNAMDNYDSRKVGPILTNRAIAFIDQHLVTNQQSGDNKPFFLYFATPEPHTPWTPPPVFNAGEPRQINHGSPGTPIENSTPISERTDMVFEADVILGAITAKLDDAGLLNNTLIIFTSDNGVNSQLTQAGYAGVGERIETGPENTQHFNAQGIVDGQPLRGYKLQIYEGGHKAPLVMRWGDGTNAGSLLEPGRTVSQLISSQDIMATLMEITGVARPPDQANDSYSYWPIMHKPAWRVIRPHLMVQGQPVVSEIGKIGRAFYQSDESGTAWKLIVDSDNADRMSNIVFAALYNLTLDPGETNNLINDGATQDQLQSMSAAYMSVIALDRTAN